MKTTMITHRVVTICATVVLAFPTRLVAEEGRISHYTAAKISSASEALSVVTGTLAEISKIVENETSSMAELEQVHQLSYTLESALNYLLNVAPTQELRSLSAAVEELHLASEKHDGKASFAALKKIQAIRSRSETQ